MALDATDMPELPDAAAIHELVQQNMKSSSHKRVMEELLHSSSDENSQSTDEYVVVEENEGHIVVGVGEICAVKDLLGRNPGEWALEDLLSSDKAPQQAEHASLIDFAIVRRRHRAGDDAGRWMTRSMEINSTRLQSALTHIFAEYPVPWSNRGPLILRPRFLPFIHRWPAVLRAAEEEKDETTRKHLNLLRITLESEISDDLERLRRIEQQKIVDFSDIELVFVPGQIVVERNDPQTTWAGRLRSCTLTQSKSDCLYRLLIDRIEFNGREFGIATKVWNLLHFNGTILLSELSITLLSFMPQASSLREKFAARGRLVRSLTGVHLKEYNGPTLTQTPEMSFVLKGPVVLDTAGYYQLGDRTVPKLRKLDDGSVFDLSSSSDFQALLTAVAVGTSGEKSPELQVLSPEQQVIVSPWIFGFALEKKQWYQLQADSIADVQVTKGPLQKVAMDENDMGLMLLCVTGTLSATSSSEHDPGKGRGLIMLFTGPPGTGKTFAAEQLAEEMQRPLYRLNMLDIDLSLSGLETGLKQALARCARWGAILLIDEADIFLQTRSSDSLCRDELAAVFLRQLEHYQGVMVLTSNRSANIDPAFESRIDLTFIFDDPREEARLKIWTNLVACEASVDVDSEELRDLAREPLNGRQIQSAIKTALCAFGGRKSPVKSHHLNTIIENRRRASRSLLGTVMALAS